MARSQWHKFYSAKVDSPPDSLFRLLSDMPNYGDWLPGSAAFGSTTEVEPYPVQLGSRYRDGKPGEHGMSWLGAVTGFQPPGSLDFHHTIDVSQLRATVDVHIHYSFEPEDGGTRLERWLILDVAMPIVLRPLRRLIITPFDKENLRTIAAARSFAETYRGTGRDAVSEAPGV